MPQPCGSCEVEETEASLLGCTMANMSFCITFEAGLSSAGMLRASLPQIPPSLGVGAAHLLSAWEMEDTSPAAASHRAFGVGCGQPWQNVTACVSKLVSRRGR